MLKENWYFCAYKTKTMDCSCLGRSFCISQKALPWCRAAGMLLMVVGWGLSLLGLHRAAEGDVSFREETFHIKLLLWGGGKRKIKSRHGKKVRTNEWTHLLKIQEEVTTKICNCRYNGSRLMWGNHKVSRRKDYVFQVFSVKWSVISKQPICWCHPLPQSLLPVEWKMKVRNLASCWKERLRKTLFW